MELITRPKSGRKIVDILERNPKGTASKYTDDDLAHMRKVNAYCKRHLAQEDHLKETKSPEELEQTKSTRSLKNWGHDRTTFPVLYPLLSYAHSPM